MGCSRMLRLVGKFLVTAGPWNGTAVDGRTHWTAHWTVYEGVPGDGELWRLVDHGTAQANDGESEYDALAAGLEQGISRARKLLGDANAPAEHLPLRRAEKRH